MSTTSTPAVPTCKRCGEPLPVPPVGRCPSCGETPSQSSERLVLLVVAVLIIATFALAQWLVRAHRQTELSLAHNWFSRGDRAMPNYPEIAAEDYRTALTYDRENDEYRLRLAQALMAAKRFPEARAHLLSLWEEEPADGEVNLSLARLFATEGKTSDAVRYYRNAINGVWRDEPQKRRVAARFELVEYLLQNHDTRQAEAELIALQADAPHDIDQQLRMAQLLLNIGDAARAQGVYEQVLKTDDKNAQAWLGDGKSSFAMGDYPAAERELAAAIDRDKNLTEARQQFNLTREILRITPNLRGLSVAERVHRVAEAFQVAVKRLTSCASEQGYNLSLPGIAQTADTGHENVQRSPQSLPNAQGTTPTGAPNNLQMLYSSALQKKNDASEAALRKNPDALESTLDFVFEVERATQPLCLNLSDTDRALLTLAGHVGNIQ